MARKVSHPVSSTDPYTPVNVYFEGKRYTFTGNKKLAFSDNRVSAAIASAGDGVRNADGRDGDNNSGHIT